MEFNEKEHGQLNGSCGMIGIESLGFRGLGFRVKVVDDSRGAGYSESCRIYSIHRIASKHSGRCMYWKSRRAFCNLAGLPFLRIIPTVSNPFWRPLL